MNRKGKILGLGGVFFKSPNPQALTEWYRQHLGLPVDENGYVVLPIRALSADGYQVFSPFKQDTTYFQPSDKAYMFNLVVDDLDAALQRVKAAGAEVMQEQERGEFGDFGWFIDPDGNKVELWQPPESGE